MNDNRDPHVDACFDTYDNPQKDLVQAVRQIILDTDPRVAEAIKWKAPTFMHRGNIASFSPIPPSTCADVSTGASLPDPDGVLGGEGDTSRVMRILNTEDLDAKTDALRALVFSWITQRG